MVETQAVTDYFAQVLRRGRLEAVSFTEGEATAAVPRAMIAAGRLPEAETQALFAAHERAAEKPPKQPVATLEVVIGLATLPTERGESRDGLLLLTATLDRDGTLTPSLETGTTPWIPAERLEAPTLTDREVMVGPLERFWRVTRTELAARISRCSTAADALALAQTLFDGVAGLTLDEFAAHHEEAGRHVEIVTCYVREYERISAVGALMPLYAHLERTGHAPALLERLVSGWDGPRRHEEELHAGDGLLLSALQAGGSMGDKHALSPSQRRAVHALLAAQDGEVTAVSGPPGTGKTTMLQAVVANLLVRHALEERDAPVIVGASTNNQAVKNIIDSFASVAKAAPGILDQRWLPQVHHGEPTDEPLAALAVFCPSGPQRKAAEKRYLVEQKDRGGLYATCSSEAYLQAATTRFLHGTQGLFGHIAEPATVRSMIHDALVEVDGYRTTLLAAMAADGPSASYLELCAQVEDDDLLAGLPGLDQLRQCQDLDALDQRLDTTLRYAAFWLAVHYYEATWLMTDDFLGAKERFKTQKQYNDRYWAQAAALTPCFVMTLYQVPRYFTLYTAPGEPPSYEENRIDLLIVDEGGQVDTPIALPAVALARRAVVVGDEKQLPPVWPLDEETDRELAEASGIPGGTWRDDLRERGLTSSAPSSLMRAASHAGRYSYGEAQAGLLLREHRRCHPDIIGICNEMLYDGLLIPTRPADDSRLDGKVPAVGWLDVPDSQDTHQGSSRVNRPEARAIADWIIRHYEELYALYCADGVEDPVSPRELIGVVTPFRAQAQVITAQIRDAVQEARTGELPEELAEHLRRGITVGTAHALQGAERPIILFSAVYGGSSGMSPFIDANPELMNVALSRAKDHFLVVAAPNRWNTGKIFELLASRAVRPQRPMSTDADPGTSAADLVPPADGAASSATVDPVEQVAPPVATEPADAAGPAADPAPARPPQPAPQGGASLSTVIRRWKEDGLLREEDAGLTAVALNLRAAEAGILAGEPGDWRPTALAGLVGVLGVPQTSSEGTPYLAITYTPMAQALLLQLYLDGTL
ncbi:DEAD/DEAH box helicase [Brachybacterium sp. YJGR34]|uniref:DEAD/DEAH box helicase n=1 Tax=Brachybacterium sp. YJGR34 TaxID=2059911 RepID=UPI000E0BF113|nr:DEAD/DEAH box helicase [Brachybacterium sp. YJGR34]